MLTMKHWVRQAGLRAVSLVLLCLFGSLLSATLVRFAPGSGVDEREIDPRLSPESKEAIRASNPANLTLLTFYEHYLRGMVHGDLGNSQWLQRPVNSLIRERFPETLRSVLVRCACPRSHSHSLPEFRPRGFGNPAYGTLDRAPGRGGCDAGGV
jgi:ABC-type dipeptide/oligopeptide/nickel transport system permease component